MYRATKDLIAERLKHTKYNNIKTVPVQYVPLGEVNQCHQNTFKYQKLDVLKTGCTRSMPVSGWLVGEYDKVKKQTEIIQHWWNLDSITNQHFDTTPLGTPLHHRKYEYVVDLEISIWGNENFARIDSNVASSLLYRDNKWLQVTLDKDARTAVDTDFNYEDIQTLDIETIFKANIV